jgi:hypothetical protein
MMHLLSASGVRLREADCGDEGNASIKASMPSRNSHSTSLRVNVRHSFRVIERRFGCMRVRYRGLAKNFGAGDGAVRFVESADGAPAVDADGGCVVSVRRERWVKIALWR